MIKEDEYFVTFSWMTKLFGKQYAKRDIYATVYGFARKSNTWHGSLTSMAELTGHTRALCSKYLNELVDEGYLIKNELELGNIYTVNRKKLDEINCYRENNSYYSECNTTVIQNVPNSNTNSNNIDIDTTKEKPLNESKDSKQDFESTTTSIKLENLDESRSDSSSVLYSKRDVKHRHGQYGHVSMTDNEWKTLKLEFPTSYLGWVQHVDTYCEKYGKSYNNYLLVIREWSNGKDEPPTKPQNNTRNKKRPSGKQKYESNIKTNPSENDSGWY